MNDQEYIKRIHEWDKIRKEMEAGSGAPAVNVSTVFSENKPPLASILHELEDELKTQEDAIVGYENALSCSEMLLARDEGEWIAQGWCEALEFAIRTIKRHNKS